MVFQTSLEPKRYRIKVGSFGRELFAFSAIGLRELTIVSRAASGARPPCVAFHLASELTQSGRAKFFSDLANTYKLGQREPSISTSRVFANRINS